MRPYAWAEGVIVTGSYAVPVVPLPKVDVPKMPVPNTAPLLPSAVGVVALADVDS